MPVLFWGISFISFLDSVYRFKGVILNAHCVEVSIVNNDASASFVYSVCCCSAQLVSQVVVKYDHMCVCIVGLYLVY